MSGQTQGGLPFDTSSPGGMMPGGTNNPTPAPGSNYLGTQQNNLWNQLYDPTKAQSIMAPPTGLSGGWGSVPTLPTGGYTPPTQQAYQGISQTAGGLASAVAEPEVAANDLARIAPIYGMLSKIMLANQKSKK